MRKLFYSLCVIVAVILVIMSISADVELWQSDLPFWLKFKIWGNS